MPTAEVITIGTELLLGENVDTNTSYIARLLRDEGIDLYRTSTIGDNKNRIAQIIREGMERSEIIITTGGLGPTIDDPTREAIALAFDVETEFSDELWKQIEDRFRLRGRKPTENNKRMAYIPKGALPIENRLGTAPAFIMETETHSVISLPGVPREMENLMQTKILPYLRKRYKPDHVIVSKILHTAGIGESKIDFIIGELEELRNPTVGLLAHAGQVDIRIAAKAKSRQEARVMIDGVESKIRQLLGDGIFGEDEDSLADVAMNHLQEKNLRIVILESGLSGLLIQKIANKGTVFVNGKVLPVSPEQSDIIKKVDEYSDEFKHDNDGVLYMGVFFYPGQEQQKLTLVIKQNQEKHISNYVYAGPPDMAPEWAVNESLNLIRRS